VGGGQGAISGADWVVVEQTGAEGGPAGVAEDPAAIARGTIGSSAPRADRCGGGGVGADHRAAGVAEAVWDGVIEGVGDGALCAGAAFGGEPAAGPVEMFWERGAGDYFGVVVVDGTVELGVGVDGVACIASDCVGGDVCMVGVEDRFGRRLDCFGIAWSID